MTKTMKTKKKRMTNNEKQMKNNEQPMKNKEKPMKTDEHLRNPVSARCCECFLSQRCECRDPIATLPPKAMDWANYEDYTKAETSSGSFQLS